MKLGCEKYQYTVHGLAGWVHYLTFWKDNNENFYLKTYTPNKPYIFFNG